jgi:hypothetical protein
MTPEERFTKIENALSYCVEIQKHMDSNLARHEAEIEKVTAGVRDLVIVSRTLIDAQKDSAARAERMERLNEESRQRFEEFRQKSEEFRQKSEESRQKFEEDLRRSNERFDGLFAALIQAQLETERALKAWINRERDTH